MRLDNEKDFDPWIEGDQRISIEYVEPLSYPFFCSARLEGLFWFRVHGYGLYFSDSRVNGVPFSERVGITKTFHLGPYRIWVLKP